MLYSFAWGDTGRVYDKGAEVLAGHTGGIVPRLMLTGVTVTSTGALTLGIILIEAALIASRAVGEPVRLIETGVALPTT